MIFCIEVNIVLKGPDLLFIMIIWRMQAEQIHL